MMTTSPLTPKKAVNADLPVDVDALACRLRGSLGPLVRRLRQVRPDGELTLSQTSALSRLDREGPASASELAAGEGITPQSMCAIIAELDRRGLIERRPDPYDGRRIVVSLGQVGADALHGMRHERARRLAAAIRQELSPAEQRQLAEALPLLERLTRNV